jgi:hypothetical protein
VLTEFVRFKSGDVKGTIRCDTRLLFVSNEIRRHRLISINYISVALSRQAAGSSPVIPAILFKHAHPDVKLKESQGDEGVEERWTHSKGSQTPKSFSKSALQPRPY